MGRTLRGLRLVVFWGGCLVGWPPATGIGVGLDPLDGREELIELLPWHQEPAFAVVMAVRAGATLKGEMQPAGLRPALVGGGGEFHAQLSGDPNNALLGRALLRGSGV